MAVLFDFVYKIEDFSLSFYARAIGTVVCRFADCVESVVVVLLIFVVCKKGVFG